jgi:hypothetical protein
LALNLYYAYVLNNPLSFVDPLGLECVWDDGSFDSNDDPRTGNTEQGRASSSSDGGTWYEPTDFANREPVAHSSLFLA